MRYITILILTFFIVKADILVVAVNPKSKIDSLSIDTIKALYLDKRHILKGHKVVLLNLPFNNSLRHIFEKDILKKSRQELERYWLRAYYRGHRPPKVVKSQEAEALYIQKIDYAIGYMQKKIAQKYGLKIVYEWEIDATFYSF